MSDCLVVSTSHPLKGTCRVPGDKSISHRAAMLGGIADGISEISGFLTGRDCLATVGAMRSLGVCIDIDGCHLKVHGKGLMGLTAPRKPVDCDNSGTTMRLLAGLLAGQRFSSTLVGTPQLSRRPMLRVAAPLRKMGARIDTIADKAPLTIHGIGADGQGLCGICHEMTVQSAQVKSCILMAGLYADGETKIIEKAPLRDHTERMLKDMGSDIAFGQREIVITSRTKSLKPLKLTVPGDMSSAAFILTASCIVPGSKVTIENVNMNPTRIGIVKALKRMGAKIETANESIMAGEPVADLTVRSTALKGAEFQGDEIVTMIDELPILAVAATQASGRTVIRGAKELRVKETDRIKTTTQSLAAMGARVFELEDGMIVEGKTTLKAKTLDSLKDHRIAMSLAVAGLVAEGTTTVEGAKVISDSFPGFEKCLTAIGAPLEMRIK